MRQIPPDPSDRYIELLEAEGDYARESSFWEYFLEGMVRHRVQIATERLRPFMPDDVWQAVDELSVALAGSPAASHIGRC